MPPVRWKSSLFLPAVCMVIAVAAAMVSSSSALDSISMSDDGWRPIIGSSAQQYKVEEITQYRNPTNKKPETVKAEHKQKLETATKSTKVTSTQVAPSGLGKVGGHKPLLLIPTHGHPPIPLMHRPVKHKVYHHPNNNNNNKRQKPVRMQMPSYSSRDEVFVQAPSGNLGHFGFYNQKTRIPQSHAHIEFNHYPNQQDDLYQFIRNPIQQYVIPKHPIQNDVHYSFQTDEFTKHLVPPPFKYVKEKEKPKEEQKPYQFVPPPPPAPPAKQDPQTIEVQVTKEKLNVFHNQVPQNYNPQKEYEFKRPEFHHTLKAPVQIEYQTIKTPIEYQTVRTPIDYQTVRTPIEYQTVRSPIEYQTVKSVEYHTMKSVPVEYQTAKTQQKATYEVTEGKWPEVQQNFQYPYRQPFLPTPVKPEGVAPTLPTDNEVSTIYNAISKLNKQRATENPVYYNVKEVSTHYPIVGKLEVQEYPTRVHYKNKFEISEATTRKQYDVTTATTSTTTSTPAPTRAVQRQRRPGHRRRRPTSTTTEEAEVVTDIYDSMKTDYSAEVQTERSYRRRPTVNEVYDSSSEEVTERPLRRRPLRVRTTTTPVYEEEVVTSTYRPRQRRPRPTTVTTAEPTTTEEIPKNHKEYEEDLTPLKLTTEKEFPESFESHFQKTQQQSSTEDRYNYYTKPPRRPVRLEEVSEEAEEATTKVFDFEFLTPENEVEYTTSTTTTEAPREETTTEALTTTTTTTTTTPPPSTSSESVRTRVRGRPVKYESGTRPRFSVKDYRQRSTTSTTTTTTETPKPQVSEVVRMRFPLRSRRPLVTTPSEAEEGNTERSKFQPKEPRHSSSTQEPSTDRPFRAVNTRLRPFGRYKSTTEAPVSQKISIKPNIFNNLRRPTPISLKNRIMNKNRTTTSAPATTTENEISLEETNETDMSQRVESTIPYSVDTTTEFKKTFDFEPEEEILNDEDYMQSKMVSDLTSDAKNDYNRFRNVSPVSRNVPNYFTLATDDPILPIEAFFPNLKEKQQ
ncbi:PREDICTED: proteoglycan 4-like [Nicrophorus vespilloides]|uniref:Proteoglycan 4-like n=1 Tax=Nicrophorus vespilloides TaxID=110193 RepID=A0ABM1N166_NICVS|nr:PREDICTED: proteoglycan 4-like [Nicrophorus vespilloides]